MINGTQIILTLLSPSSSSQDLLKRISSRLMRRKKYEIMYISQYREKSYLDPISYFYQSSTIMAVNNYWVFNKIAQLCASKKKKTLYCFSFK